MVYLLRYNWSYSGPIPEDEFLLATEHAGWSNLSTEYEVYECQRDVPYNWGTKNVTLTN